MEIFTYHKPGNCGHTAVVAVAGRTAVAADRKHEYGNKIGMSTEHLRLDDESK
jgi:hypothetical protein